MRKLSGRNGHLRFLVLLFLSIIAITGCRKNVDQSANTESPKPVSMQEIKEWTSSFIPKLKPENRPVFLYELAQKTIVTGRSYVRVPALGAKAEDLGFFYFTKTREGALQSLYIQTSQKDKTKLDGMVGFVDFDNHTYTVAAYQNNKPVALYGMKDTKALFENAFGGSSNVNKPRVNGACEVATSIVKGDNGNDSVVVKIKTLIDCPNNGGQTFWQWLGGLFSDIWGGITAAFDFLFGWMGGGGGSSSGGYSAGGSFVDGGYNNLGFNGYVSGGYGGGGGSDPSTGGGGPNVNDPYRGPWEPLDPDTIPSFLWVFTGDDGTTFSDPDPSLEPDLQFDPADNIETKYPNLVNLVKTLKSFVRNTPEVMSALQKYSGMSKQKILEILTYGKGLTIKVDDNNMDGIYANYNRVKYGVNILRIKGSYVRGLEIAVLPSTKRATAFLLAASMLHELVHYGTGQNKINEGIYDFGYGFERDAFTMIVEDNNAGNLVLLFKKF